MVASSEAGVALADALDRRRPQRRRQALGVVVQGEEVEPGAVAREVAGVVGRVRALAAEEGEREDEASTE
jgi:hypothetical protein